MTEPSDVEEEEQDARPSSPFGPGRPPLDRKSPMNHQELAERRRALGRASYERKKEFLKNETIKKFRVGAINKRWSNQRAREEAKEKKNFNASFRKFKYQMLPNSFHSKCAVLRALIKENPDCGLQVCEVTQGKDISKATFFRKKSRCQQYLLDHPHLNKLLLTTGRKLAKIDYAGFRACGIKFVDEESNMPLNDHAQMLAAQLNQKVFGHKTNMKEDMRIKNHEVGIQLYKVSYSIFNISN